jgi:hypothetical protein
MMGGTHSLALGIIMPHISDRPVEPDDVVPCPEGCVEATMHRHLTDGTVQTAHQGVGVTDSGEVVHGPAIVPSDYAFGYRVTQTYGNDVVPPAVPGEVAWRQLHTDRADADQAIEMAVARTDLGRILLEERLINDVKLRQNEWRVIHAWTRTAEGWRHQ